MAYINDRYSALEEAMRLQQQRSRQRGTALAPQERASIISGTLAPYVAEYNRRIGAAEELRMGQQRLNLYERQIKNEEEANKMAGYGQWAQLGLYAMPLFQKYGNDFTSWYTGWRARRDVPWWANTINYPEHGVYD